MADNDEERPFRFFDLPRELRDWCYEYLTADYDSLCVKAANENRITPKLTSGPLPYLLRINRQFKSEYADSIKKSAELVLVDTPDRQPALNQPKGNVFSLINSVRMELLVVESICNPAEDDEDDHTCNFVADTNYHLRWIKSIQEQLCGVKSGHIVLCILNLGSPTWTAYQDCPGFGAFLKSFTSFEFITQLEIRLMESEDTITPHGTPHGIWKKSGGWQYESSKAVEDPQESITW